MLALIPSCSLRQGLEVTGGDTESVFPKVDQMLLDETNGTDYQQALEFVTKRKSMYRYRSMVDFLFCEVFEQFQNDCFRFYAGRGPCIAEMVEQGRITPAQIKWFQGVLVFGLDHAVSTMRDGRAKSWQSFRADVHGMHKCGEMPAAIAA